jgi:hypothetical protein
MQQRETETSALYYRRARIAIRHCSEDLFRTNLEVPLCYERKSADTLELTKTVDPTAETTIVRIEKVSTSVKP